MGAPSIAIVAPVHNEAGALPALLAELEVAVTTLAGDGHAVRVVLVDDGSTDGSTQLLAEHARAHGWSQPLLLAANRGQTAAMAAGVAATVEDLVVLMDADGQNDPADIARLVGRQQAANVDVVAGRRADRAEGGARRLVSRNANRLAATISGTGLRDTGCSLKVFRGDVVRALPWLRDDHRFLPAWARLHGATIAEVDVNDRAREHGTSHYGMARIPRVAVDLFGMWVAFAFRDRPLRASATLGLLLASLWWAAAVVLATPAVGLYALAGMSALVGVSIVAAATCIGAVVEASRRVGGG